ASTFGAGQILLPSCYGPDGDGIVDVVVAVNAPYVASLSPVDIFRRQPPDVLARPRCQGLGRRGYHPLGPMVVFFRASDARVIRVESDSIRHVKLPLLIDRDNLD